MTKKNDNLFQTMAELIAAGVDPVSREEEIWQRYGETVAVCPDVVGVEGNTWESRSEFFGALRRAISIPVMALTAIALVVVVFGVFLLESAEIGDAGPIVLAGVVASLILGGASFVAYKK